MTTTPKSILVTGAAKRLGRAIALRLAAPGRRIAIHFKESFAEAEAVAKECREQGAERVLVAQADMADPEQAAAMVDRVAGEIGLDALVNNASVYYPTKIGETTEEQFDDLMAVNAKGPFFAAQAAARWMLKNPDGGSILNLIDATWDRPAPSYIPYGMSKAALAAMTYGMARALAPKIRVNAIAPGAMTPPEWASDSQVAASLARAPLGRLGEPEDIASAAEYLLFHAPYVTGVILPVDGGRTVG